MKTIGIIGGLGPEATQDYYKEIINRFNEIHGDGNLNYPEIVIYCVNMAQFIGFMNAGKYAEATEYITLSLKKLKEAGADFAAISANTPHLLYDHIQEQSSLPLISIVESVKNVAVAQSLKRAGLIGTKFTMKATFYHKVFKQAKIEIITPNDSEIETINDKLFKEIELGIFKNETKELILSIIKRMIERDLIDSLILGCTEFPILFKDSHYYGIPFLNTTRIHVNAIVNESLK